VKINSKGIQLIKTFEGCLLNAYLDSVKIATIGYGATYYQNGSKVKIGDKITQEQANELLVFHLGIFADGVDDLIDSEINENQFSALVSFAFNLGLGNLKKSTLLKKVNQNPEDKTIADEFLRWNKAGGKVLPGLTRRRKAESELYFKI
jgi:lysozyme